MTKRCTSTKSLIVGGCTGEEIDSCEAAAFQVSLWLISHFVHHQDRQDENIAVALAELQRSLNMSGTALTSFACLQAQADIDMLCLRAETFSGTAAPI